jgi:hypothetical protein
MPKQKTGTTGPKLARDFVKHFFLPKPEKKGSRYFWAFLKLYDLVHDEPDLAWPIIKEILHIDSSDAMLAYVAAGPIEDLLAQHGTAFIERIEELAGRDPIFRKALGAVWRSKIPEDVWKRLKAVAGPDF